MKNTFRKTIAFLLIATMLISGSAMAFAQENVPKVMLNGEYVAFTDAAPQNIDNRVMVPFTAILEALGATVQWDQTEKTVTATKDDETISFTIGKPDVMVKKGEDAKTMKMDVVPFVDSKSNRTYVGTRFMAEAFGYTVGWDQKEKTAIIVDYDKIFGNIEKDFSIMNKLSTTDQMDMTKTYESTSQMKMALTIAGAVMNTDKDVAISIDGNMDTVQKGMDADMDMTLKIDLKQLVEMVGKDMSADEKAAVEAQVKALENIDMKIKMNGETGDAYIQCPLLAVFAGDETVTPETWYKMNIYDLYKSMNIDLKEMMDMSMNLSAGKIDMKDFVTKIAESSSSSMTVDTYKTMNGIYEAAKAIFGDEALKVTKSGSTTTYTSEFTGDTIVKAFMNTENISDYLKDMNAAEAKELQDMLNSITGKLSMSEKDGKVIDSSFNFAFSKNGTKVAIEVKGNSEKMDMTMSFEIPKAGKFDMTMNMTMKETSKTLDISIPSDAKVVDITSFLSLTAQTPAA